MAKILPFTEKLEEKPEAERANEARSHQAFRDSLAALGFDPAMADWEFVGEADADGNIIPETMELIVPERGDG